MWLLAIIIGIILAHIIVDYIKEHRGYKYKWTCPKCGNFRTSASNQDIIDRVKATHTCGDFK